MWQLLEDKEPQTIRRRMGTAQEARTGVVGVGIRPGDKTEVRYAQEGTPEALVRQWIKRTDWREPGKKFVNDDLWIPGKPAHNARMPVSHGQFPSLETMSRNIVSLIGETDIPLDVVKGLSVNMSKTPMSHPTLGQYKGRKSQWSKPDTISLSPTIFDQYDADEAFGHEFIHFLQQHGTEDSIYGKSRLRHGQKIYQYSDLAFTEAIATLESLIAKHNPRREQNQGQLEDQFRYTQYHMINAGIPSHASFTHTGPALDVVGTQGNRLYRNNPSMLYQVKQILEPDEYLGFIRDIMGKDIRKPM